MNFGGIEKAHVINWSKLTTYLLVRRSEYQDGDWRLDKIEAVVFERIKAQDGAVILSSHLLTMHNRLKWSEPLDPINKTGSSEFLVQKERTPAQYTTPNPCDWTFF